MLVKILYSSANKIYRNAQRLLGVSTVGVRAIVLNKENQILLVKHSYQPKWYLPGGAVKAKETPAAAIIREVAEETGVIVNGQPQLLGIFLHIYMGVSDYPVLFKITNFSQKHVSSLEIEEMGWFDYSNLPHDVTRATKRRLDEYFLNLPLADKW